MNKLNNEVGLNKEDAINILDRIIGFINNCDTKASIILGIFSATIALIFTTDGITEIKRIINVAISNKLFCNLLYLFLWGASLTILIIGLYKLATVLVAKIDCSDMTQKHLEADSKLFFSHIAMNKTYEQYKTKFQSIAEEEFLNDLVSQIYINSIICDNKFKKYNMGLRLTIIGCFGFIVLWAIGSYLF